MRRFAHNRSRSALLWIAATLVALAAIEVRPLEASTDDPKTQPNFVIIFADDLGYGDLGCYGHPTIRTPNLDTMAQEGMLLTQFYSASPVCTPSRAALLTGRLPIRTGMYGSRRRVMFPFNTGGLPQSEITIAEALRESGYATACFGKWHLGHERNYLPTNNGFDRYLGIPYSNDMNWTLDPLTKKRAKHIVPLMRNNEIVEQPVDQHSVTRRYTEEAVRFIAENKDKPFFLYLPHTMPHVPLFASEDFAGKSPRGLYGDVVEEIDWSVGQVLDTLRKHKLDNKTLVVFTSDNGPWLGRGNRGGSAGLLRGGKGSTWEGGMREPTIAWRPGFVSQGAVSQQVASTMDLFATCLSQAGVELPKDRVLDSYDLTPALTEEGPTKREVLYYYRGDGQLQALRKGPWKIHIKASVSEGLPKVAKGDPPLLFHLDHDPSEKRNVAKKNPKVVADLLKEIETHQANLKPIPSKFDLSTE